MLSKLIKILRNISGIDGIKSNLEKHSLTMSQYSQIIQKNYFCSIKNNISKNFGIKDSGFSVFSQFDEDGIILYIFGVIGFTNKYCLDIVFANPFGANTTNLLLNWGFNGLLVCGEEKERISSESFFKENHNTWLLPPRIINNWVTQENIKGILVKNHVPSEIDFFSLDMDGVDYYILQEVLKTVYPRVIVVEAHNIWKTEKSVAVKYSHDFDRHKIHEDYCSASIPAFVKLLKANNYKLVACNKYAFNLFFVRENLGGGYLPEIRAEECIANLPDYYIDELDKRRKNIEDLDWVEV